MALARTVVALAALLLVAAGPASAGTPLLKKTTARGVAAKTADKVRRDLEGEGAKRSGVAGCWRNNRLRVSCYLEIKGYDAELEYRWTCMLRVVVQLRPGKTGRARLKSRYGTAVCG